MYGEINKKRRGGEGGEEEKIRRQNNQDITGRQNKAMCIFFMFC